MLEPLHGVAVLSCRIGAAAEMAGAGQEQGAPAAAQDLPPVTWAKWASRGLRSAQVSGELQRRCQSGGSPSSTRVRWPGGREALMARTV
jgi:hypothetical protein